VDRMGNPIFENARWEIHRIVKFHEIEGHPIRQNQKWISHPLLTPLIFLRFHTFRTSHPIITQQVSVFISARVVSANIPVDFLASCLAQQLLVAVGYTRARSVAPVKGAHAKFRKRRRL